MLFQPCATAYDSISAYSMDLTRNRREAEHVGKIRQALRDKKLVIIIGAGVSLCATRPSPPRITWTGLIQDGMDYLVDEGFIEPNNEDLNYHRGTLQRPNGITPHKRSDCLTRLQLSQR
jgi:hypothetical protein